jgi:two-component system, sensor histidine kinase and response regulator
MTKQEEQLDNLANAFRLEIKRRSDRLMNYSLIGYFLIGITLAVFYDTWLVALGVGGLSLLAYYSAKIMLPNSSLYQYVLSGVFGIFMAQFIYQMHGLFEMHFFAFIGSAMLITYQKWKLQIPVLFAVFLHHLIFGYLQNIGYDKIYFTQLEFFTLQTFIINILLTSAIFFTCGLWAFQLKKYNEIQITQTLQVAELQKEAQLSIERKLNAEALSELNKNLQQQTKELEFSNAELEQFAYVASHDLQEPLRMITSFLSRLEKKYSDVIDEKGKQYIHFAVDGSNRMQQLIFELLEFSRVGRTEDKLEEIDLQLLVAEICSLYRNEIQEKNAIIQFNSLPALQSFKAPIRQVFQNLIGNSLKYQEPGETPLISISCEDAGQHWKFYVKDNGIGINEDDFGKIFIIFQRLYNKEVFPGTGMGLAVTKKIIENLGGEIWVESEVDKGSTFYFTIPK